MKWNKNIDLQKFSPAAQEQIRDALKPAQERRAFRFGSDWPLLTNWPRVSTENRVGIHLLTIAGGLVAVWLTFVLVASASGVWGK